MSSAQILCQQVRASAFPLSALHRSMPPRSDPPREPRRPASQPDLRSRGRAARQSITFVDSQDPHSRSAIQRHTAYHSNAQRRDARLQSLRNTSRPRLLEWQRRATQSPASQTSSNSSSSLSVLPSLERSVTSQDPSPDPRDLVVGPAINRTDPSTETATENNTAQYILRRLCLHTENRQAYEDATNFMLGSQTCTQLLTAYSLALRIHNGDSTDVSADRIRAQGALARGTILLRDRLNDLTEAASDESIQAVLLLIAYTADFGDPSTVRIHTRALQMMLAQRGGIHGTQFHEALAMQLNTIRSSRRFHLTLDCASLCISDLRFPQGFPEQ